MSAEPVSGTESTYSRDLKSDVLVQVAYDVNTNMLKTQKRCPGTKNTPSVYSKRGHMIADEFLDGAVIYRIKNAPKASNSTKMVQG